MYEWKIVEHNWSDTSIMEGDEVICTLSIYDEATEENQEELEEKISKRARLLVSAPDLLEFVKEAKSLLNYLQIPPNLVEWYGNFEMNSSELIKTINND